MVRKIINVLFCVGGLNSLVAGDKFTNLVLGEGDDTRTADSKGSLVDACEKIRQGFTRSRIEESKESKSEYMPEPILSLDSQISSINRRLKTASDTLSWIKPPYTEQEIYSGLETEFIEIQNTFDAISRHDNASVAKRLTILTSVMSAFEVKLGAVIEFAMEEDRKTRPKY